MLAGCLGVCVFFFFLQAEDGIRGAQESRGLGDVYKRQRHELVKSKVEYMDGGW